MSPARIRPLTSRDPERVGGHRLLGRLGEGGQGVVHLAAAAGEHVAIKLLHERAGSHATFLKETTTARKVAPFCTARILDVGKEAGTPFVVTEFIDGPSLRERVEEGGALAGPELYRLVVGTATALAAIHMAGVVHRDFKPGNVLLGPDGPRVIDFGVARTLDATLTATSSVIGTPSYMAPEQLVGKPVTPAADVFAWGATLAYAANGPGPLRTLLAQCLHKDPTRRPASRAILLHLLEAASFTAEGGMTQSTDAFEATGRLHFNPGAGTNYDVTVRNPSGDMSESYNQRVILVGNNGYFRNQAKTPYPAGPNAGRTDPHIWMAMQARWVTSPYNILALLRNTTSLRTTPSPRSTRTSAEGPARSPTPSWSPATTSPSAWTSTSGRGSPPRRPSTPSTRPRTATGAAAAPSPAPSE
ncbi:serine/threonine-protein kinase [Actinomadura rugatobispora]|uniref:Serine/threonine-protein kinase n=1 Tax=Actinomadura rugatobispora TaxID=1994 RepID=A0ABW1A4D7_9ACTN|nr:hypothetical protein GCM10010200_007440 [Actinomadura rugatobispora]